MHRCIYASFHLCIHPSKSMHPSIYAPVYLCIYASMCLCTYASIHLYASMRLCISASMHLSIFANMHLCIYASMHLCIYASIHLCIHVSMYPCIYVMYLFIYVSIYICVYPSMHLCINPAMHLQYASMRIFVFGSKRSKHDPRTKNPTQLQLAPRPCIQRVLNDSSPYPQEHGKKRLHEDLLANTVRRCKRLPNSTKILLVLPQLHHAISRASWHPAQSTNSTQGARHEFPWAHFNESKYFQEPRDCCGS